MDPRHVSYVKSLPQHPTPPNQHKKATDLSEHKWGDWKYPKSAKQ